jgi:hypothetical protein
VDPLASFTTPNTPLIKNLPRKLKDSLTWSFNYCISVDHLGTCRELEVFRGFFLQTGFEKFQDVVGKKDILKFNQFLVFKDNLLISIIGTIEHSQERLYVNLKRFISVSFNPFFIGSIIVQSLLTYNKVF